FRVFRMGKVCPMCGPKMSAFCMVMSVWGVVFLGLLGVFFYLQAVTLFPDLHFAEEKDALDNQKVEAAFAEKANQCWIAAGMYFVTLILVFWQNKFNTASVF
ncbi:hypothetical protein PFISCL1PPCAC_15510, partial [Pristionchus fissidentatus]